MTQYFLLDFQCWLFATERWEEEWQCTQWKEGGLTNCKEETKKEMAISYSKNACKEELGEDWTYNRTNPYDSAIKYCHKTEIVCEHEKICTQQQKNQMPNHTQKRMHPTSIRNKMQMGRNQGMRNKRGHTMNQLAKGRITTEIWTPHKRLITRTIITPEWEITGWKKWVKNRTP